MIKSGPASDSGLGDSVSYKVHVFTVALLELHFCSKSLIQDLNLLSRLFIKSKE